MKHVIISASFYYFALLIFRTLLIRLEKKITHLTLQSVKQHNILSCLQRLKLLTRIYLYRHHEIFLKQKKILKSFLKQKVQKKISLKILPSRKFLTQLTITTNNLKIFRQIKNSLSEVQNNFLLLTYANLLTHLNPQGDLIIRDLRSP